MTYRHGIGRVTGADARRHEAGRYDRDGTHTDVVPPSPARPEGGIA
jgi:hypothetical protein